MTSTGNLICSQTSLEKFGLAVRPRGAQPRGQFDQGNRGQIARGTVLPKAWATPISLCTVLVALDESYLLAWISRGMFGFFNLLVVKKLLLNASNYAYNKIAKMAYYWYC